MNSTLFLNIWMQLILLVTVTLRKGFFLDAQCVGETHQVWRGTAPFFDMIRQDCVSVMKFALSHTWIRTPNPTRLAFQRGGHLFETSAPFRRSWSTCWTVAQTQPSLSDVFLLLSHTCCRMHGGISLLVKAYKPIRPFTLVTELENRLVIISIVAVPAVFDRIAAKGGKIKAK